MLYFLKPPGTIFTEINSLHVTQHSHLFLAPLVLDFRCINSTFHRLCLHRLELLLPFVLPPVLGQCVRLDESFRAQLALVRAPSGVNEDVPKQVVLLLEGFAAAVAGVGSFVAVGLEVPHQHVLLGEGLRAELATMGSLVRVRPDVDLHGVETDEALAAQVTAVRS